MSYTAFKKPEDKRIMRLFVTCPDFVRRMIITENQAKLIQKIMRMQSDYITASMLSFQEDISIQGASTKLSKLWVKGYLVRKEVPDETGGIRYQYKSAI